MSDDAFLPGAISIDDTAEKVQAIYEFLTRNESGILLLLGDGISAQDAAVQRCSDMRPDDIMYRSELETTLGVESPCYAFSHKERPGVKLIYHVSAWTQFHTMLVTFYKARVVKFRLLRR
jgi:hypothetical protein